MDKIEEWELGDAYEKKKVIETKDDEYWEKEEPMKT